jgi:hypothetical protein
MPGCHSVTNPQWRASLASGRNPRHNPNMAKGTVASRRGTAANETDVFVSGAAVMVTLSNPREKFWGAIITVSPAGVSLRGIGLESFEDFVRQVRDGDSVTASAVFFPMHRIERMELDERNGDVPSMVERFKVKCGHDATEFLSGELRR